MVLQEHLHSHRQRVGTLTLECKRNTTTNVMGLCSRVLEGLSPFSSLTARNRDPIGVMGLISRTGACLLPAAGPNRIDFSGELYIPKTSANASFVASVTVGSAVANLRVVVLFPLLGSPENPTRRFLSASGGGPHFLPRRPIERARASCMQYSWPSAVNSSDRLNLRFSFRFPGGGG